MNGPLHSLQPHVIASQMMPPSPCQEVGLHARLASRLHSQPAHQQPRLGKCPSWLCTHSLTTLQRRSRCPVISSTSHIAQCWEGQLCKAAEGFNVQGPRPIADCDIVCEDHCSGQQVRCSVTTKTCRHAALSEGFASRERHACGLVECGDTAPAAG